MGDTSIPSGLDGSQENQNVFRVPSLPARVLKRNSSVNAAEPLSVQDTNTQKRSGKPSTSVVNSKNTLSSLPTDFGDVIEKNLTDHSGTRNLTPAPSPRQELVEKKKSAMIKKLAERDAQRKMKNEARDQEEVKMNLDLTLTEQSFIDGLDGVSSNSQFNAPPAPRFSDISMIQHSSLMTTPKKKVSHVQFCSTPIPQSHTPSLYPSTPRSERHPGTAERVASPTSQLNATAYESLEDRYERQMRALSVWCNMLLCGKSEPEFDIGKTKTEATKRLQNLLVAAPSKQQHEIKKMTYSEFLERQERDSLREKAAPIMASSNIPQKIREMCLNGTVSIHDNNNVYDNISVKTTLLRVFLAFHPAWLHLGMETVFGETIDVQKGESFVRVIAQFINTRLFTDPVMMKNKKYALGSGKKLVTPAGRDALHCHFLTKTCQFFYFVETAKNANVLPANPPIFVRNSSFKSLEDVCGELQRELLAARGAPLAKALSKLGFKSTYKQDFFDDFNYRVAGFADLQDGIVLGRLVEIISGHAFMKTKLRNPSGDRLRKINNMTAVLAAAKNFGIDIDNVKPDVIVGGNREAILGLLWRIVGIYVLATEEKQLRRFSLRLSIGGLGVGRTTNYQGETESDQAKDLVLHVCKQIGDIVGIKVRSLKDLRDGRLLAAAWHLYNPSAPDVHFFPGDNLYMQVANAAESEFEVPIGLHGEVSLFAHLFLSRLFKIRETEVAATKIQRAYRSYLRQKNGIEIEQPKLNEMLYTSFDSCSNSAHRQTFVVSVGHQFASQTMTISDGDSVEIVLPDDENTGPILDIVPIEEPELSVQYTQEELSFIDITPVPVERTMPNNLASQSELELDHFDDADKLALDFVDDRSQVEESERLSMRRANDEIAAEEDMLIVAEQRLQQRQNEEEEKSKEIEKVRLAEVEQKRIAEEAAMRVAEQERLRLEEEARMDRERAFAEAERRRLALEEEEKERLLIEETERNAREQAERQRIAEEEAEQLRELERQRLADEAEIAKQTAAVCRIQSWFRGCQVRQQYNRMVLRQRIAEEEAEQLRELERQRLADEAEIAKQTAAVCRIQSWFRGCQVRKQYNRMVVQRNSLIKAATTIQHAYRIKLAMKQLSQLKVAQARRVNAAIVIQSGFRILVAKRTVAIMRHMRAAAEAEAAHIRALQVQRENAAAITIQRFYRGMSARWRCDVMRLSAINKKEIDEYMHSRKIDAAIKIQKTWRGYNQRRLFAFALEDRRIYEANVIIVQSLVRRFLAKKRYETIRIARDEEFAVKVASIDYAQDMADNVSVANIEELLPGDNVATNDSNVEENTDAHAGREQENLDPIAKQEYYDLRRLYNEVKQVKLKQKKIERTLQCVRQLKQLQQEESSPDVIRSSAAVVIQKRWRGYKTRLMLSTELKAREEAMIAYRGTMFREGDVLQVRGDVVSPSENMIQKLHWAAGEVFHPSTMSKLEAAACILRRISRLAPWLIAKEYEGVGIILKALESCNQSCGGKMIAQILHATLLNLVKAGDISTDSMKVIYCADRVIQKCAQSLCRFLDDSETVKYAGETLLECSSKVPDVTRYFTSEVRYYVQKAANKLISKSDGRSIILQKLKELPGMM